MDTLECGTDEMRAALRFLEMSNRHFGGTRVILKHLEAFSKAWKPGEEIRILDVGAGLADIDRQVIAWAKEKHLRVTITALELVPQIAELARNASRNIPNLSIEAKDIFSYPYGDHSFDYVAASLFLHHMPSSQLENILKKFDAI